MAAATPNCPPEEFARRGDALYERSIRPLVESQHADEIVAIDIDSGEWEVDPDEIAACNRLESRQPNAQIWLVRVGSRAVRQFGAWRGDPQP